ncbi:MAG: LysE family transporter [Methylobacteriaceae bacterium]|nr:LysE family transporter [Methylobacteriaceae bacterium]
MTDAILAGALVGLSVAMPVGPLAMLLIERTLTRGFAAGLATGFAASSVHAVYGTLATVWSQAASAALAGHLGTFSLVSALVLAVMAARCLSREPAAAGKPPAGTGTLVGAYGSSLVIGFGNPTTLVLFAAALPALGALGSRQPHEVVLGIVLGSVGWWFVLSALVAQARSALPPAMVRHLSRVVGLLLLALALRAGFGALGLP